MGRSVVFEVGNVVAAAWCTVGVALVGLALMLAGAVVAGMAYTQIRPNFADDNYNRFIGANLDRIVGPVLLCFGLLLLIGCCVFFGCAFMSANRDYKNSSSSSAAGGNGGHGTGYYSRAPQEDKDKDESYP